MENKILFNREDNNLTGKHKRKSIITVIGFFVLGISLLIAYPISQGWFSASIIGENNLAKIQFVDPDEALKNAAKKLIQDKNIAGETLNIDTTDQRPYSPVLRNSYNPFSDEYQSWLSLILKYKNDISGSGTLRNRLYFREILSYIIRMHKNQILENKLPIDPNEKLARAGEVDAYLFAPEPNPALFSQLIGIRPVGQKSEYILSRIEAIEIIKKLFFKKGMSNEEVIDSLQTIGIITDKNLWKQTHHLGFHMVEFVKVVLDLVEINERKNILTSREKYEKKLIDLPKNAVTINANTIKLLANAFAQEGNPIAVPDVKASVITSLISEYEGVKDNTMTSDLITKIRASYYKLIGVQAPKVYQLKELNLLGDCQNLLDKKMYLDSVAVTAPGGAGIICGKFMIYIPGNTYIINGYSLPKVQAFTDKKGKSHIKTYSARSYKNTIFIGENGEEKITFIYRPNELENLVTDKKDFTLGIADENGNELASIKKQFEEAGAVTKITPRAFNGNNIAIFETN